MQRSPVSGPPVARAGASLRPPGRGPSLLPSVWSRLPSLMSAEGRSSPCRFPDPHGVFIREEIVPTMLGSNVPLVWRRLPHSAAVPPCQLGPRFSRRDQHTGLREDSLVHLSGFCSTYKSNVSSALVVKKNETLRKCICEPRSAHALAVF